MKDEEVAKDAFQAGVEGDPVFFLLGPSYFIPLPHGVSRLA